MNARMVLGVVVGMLVLAACTAPAPAPTVAPPLPPPVTETPLPTPIPTPEPTIDLSFLPELPGSIAFLSNRSGTAQVYVMTPDGQDIRRLNEMPVGRRLAWSPDGERLVFTGIAEAAEGALGNLFVIAGDGTGLTQLTDVLALRADFDMPQSQIAFVSAWSPDGARLSFNLEEWAFLMDADGSHPEEFASSCQCAGVTWSPDGIQIAFGDVFSGRIWVSNAQGEEAMQLAETRNPGEESAELQELAYLLSYDIPNPRWSPDGSQLAFVSMLDGNPEIYIINADGTGHRRLTHNPGLDLGPVWSPDGQFIAFFSNRSGNFDVYIFRLSDGLVVNLTNNPAEDLDPAWTGAPISPDLPRGE